MGMGGFNFFKKIFAVLLVAVGFWQGFSPDPLFPTALAWLQSSKMFALNIDWPWLILVVLGILLLGGEGLVARVRLPWLTQTPTKSPQTPQEVPPTEIVKAYRLQQDNPEWYIKPFISAVALLPDPLKDMESANYINVTLGWDNRTLQEVSISNIKGTLSIGGADPPCDLPASVPDYNLKPLTPHLCPITVTLSREHLRIVRDVRQRGYGRVNILLKLSAQMKSKQAAELRSLDPLSVEYTAYYINEGVLQQQLHSIPNMDLRLRTELVPLPNRAKDAQDILVIGRTARIAISHPDFFRAKLLEGANIRLALANAENEAVVEAFIPLIETSGSRQTLIGDFQSTLGFARGLFREVEPKLGKEKVGLKVRLFDYVPTLSIVVVDGQSKDGHVIVEMGPYKVGTSNRPWFRLDAKEQPDWFAYFRGIAEQTWKDATPYPLDTNPS